MTALEALPRSPEEHVRLHLAAAVHLLRDVFPRPEDAPELVGFLSSYYVELDRLGLPAGGDPGRWWSAVADWERSAAAPLPLARLRAAAGLDPVALTMLAAVALPEEDGRFALLADAAGVSDRRMTLGLLLSWWRRSVPATEVGAAFRCLLDLGLVEVGNPQAPRGEWALRVAPAAWEVLRGERPERPADWARHTPRGDLPLPADLVLPADVAHRLSALPGLLVHEGAALLVLRGRTSSGRGTLAAALAAQLGRGVLLLADTSRLDGLAGPLATMLDALPVVRVDAGPGEQVTVPAVRACSGPVVLLLGRHGAVTGPGAAEPFALTLDVPTPSLRAVHWQAALGDRAPADVRTLAGAWRLPAGTIRRAGRLARASAAVRGPGPVDEGDVRGALGQLGASVLDRLAARVEASGDWEDLAVAPSTRRELELLELRCRHRERLAGSLGPSAAPVLGTGVRALFSGPSGTGKTLAARLLASALGKDLYAVDLATVVDKYLGETEKNLEAVLAAAEDLDVVLLLDEGDALLAQRTDVRSSHDRYANLETNYLLHRLESFDGVVVVTTNAGDRIDTAFSRRIDVVVDFRAPDVAERWSLWELHLPPLHRVGNELLDEVVHRCALSGGQIRNAVLHASLLALERGDEMSAQDVEDAVRREYRKGGSACPLREPAGRRA